MANARVTTTGKLRSNLAVLCLDDHGPKMIRTLSFYDDRLGLAVVSCFLCSNHNESSSHTGSLV